MTITFLSLVFSIATSISAAVAFFTPPPEVTYGGIIYRADRGDDGIVQALDQQSKKLLYKIRLYSVQIDPGLEADVQWIYIQSITQRKGRIIIINGNETQFSLDPKTRTFAVIEPTNKRK